MSPTLLLVPTPFERERLVALGGFAGAQGEVHLAGFGPIAAAARTAGLLARLEPERVLLLGLAGTLDPERLPVATASAFGEVLLDGVGAGEGVERLGPAAMGLPQWPGGEGTELEAVAERLSLAGEGPTLLTVCAASAGAPQAEERRRRFPGAVAEEMEGFGVALACALARVPLSVVRGISNVAGDRDRARWHVDEALVAARRRALEVLEEEA